MKLLFLVSSLGIGGAERQTISLINNLENFDVHLLSLSATNDLVGEISSGKLKSFRSLNKKNRFDLLRLLAKVSSIIRSVAPDIIYLVNSYPVLFGYLSKVLSGSHYKLVASLHSTSFRNTYSSLLFRSVYRPLLNKLDHIVFVSKVQRDFWQTHYDIRNVNTSVIYNGISLAKFRNFRLADVDKQKLRAQLGLQESDLVFCMCTALRPEKNHLLAISALQRLLNDKIPARLVIVGEGQMRKQIETVLNRNNLTSSVHLVGAKQDIRPYLALANVFLLTSSSVETFSIAVLEAMAMGKPIIAPNIGGLCEQVFHGKNGFLFQKDNERQLVECIINMYKNGMIESMGSSSREIVSQFDEKIMARKYERLFTRLTEGSA